MLTLKEGDKVAIIAPAAYLPNDNHCFVQKGLDVLRSWGLEVLELYDHEKRHFYLAGDDQYRSQQLVRSLQEPDIKAVFVSRGGYGCARLLPMISQLEQSTPRLFCGYSDVTALNLAIEGHMPSIQAIHGPSIFAATFAGEGCDADSNRQRLHDLLFFAEQGLEQELCVLNEGAATAPMSGGCLSIVMSLIGTPFEPDFTGKILFLEDVGEKPYTIDRMLTQLRQSGKLSGIKGLVFGDMSTCTDNQNDIQSVLADVLKGVEFPVVSGFDAGHGTRNHAFAYGQTAQIDTQSRMFRLLKCASN